VSETRTYLVAVSVRAKDDGEFPSGPGQAGAALKDVLCDVTRHDENFPWAVTGTAGAVWTARSVYGAWRKAEPGACAWEALEPWYQGFWVRLAAAMTGDAPLSPCEPA
jgi:hypothetical protein